MKQLLPITCLATLLITLFFPAQDLYAVNLDECLLESIKYADHSVTVGQLHEQCQQETRTISRAIPQDSSAVEISVNGPTEMVLKTEQARKPAYFPHKKHQQKYLCGRCHHGKDPSGKLAKYNEKPPSGRRTTFDSSLNTSNHQLI